MFIITCWFNFLLKNRMKLYYKRFWYVSIEFDLVRLVNRIRSNPTHSIIGWIWTIVRGLTTGWCGSVSSLAVQPVIPSDHLRSLWDLLCEVIESNQFSSNCLRWFWMGSNQYNKIRINLDSIRSIHGDFMLVLG